MLEFSDSYVAKQTQRRKNIVVKKLFFYWMPVQQPLKPLNLDFFEKMERRKSAKQIIDKWKKHEILN